MQHPPSPEPTHEHALCLYNVLHRDQPDHGRRHQDPHDQDREPRDQDRPPLARARAVGRALCREARQGQEALCQGRGEGRQGRGGGRRLCRAQGALCLEPPRRADGRRDEAERLGELDGPQGHRLAGLAPRHRQDGRRRRERGLRLRRRREDGRQVALARSGRHGPRLLPEGADGPRRSREGAGLPRQARREALCRLCLGRRRREGGARRRRGGRAAQEGRPQADDGRAEGRGEGQARGQEGRRDARGGGRGGGRGQARGRGQAQEGRDARAQEEGRPLLLQVVLRGEGLHQERPRRRHRARGGLLGRPLRRQDHRRERRGAL